MVGEGGLTPISYGYHTDFSNNMLYCQKEFWKTVFTSCYISSVHNHPFRFPLLPQVEHPLTQFYL